MEIAHEPQRADGRTDGQCATAYIFLHTKPPRNNRENQSPPTTTATTTKVTNLSATREGPSKQTSVANACVRPPTPHSQIEMWIGGDLRNTVESFLSTRHSTRGSSLTNVWISEQWSFCLKAFSGLHYANGKRRRREEE